MHRKVAQLPAWTVDGEKAFADTEPLAANVFAAESNASIHLLRIKQDHDNTVVLTKEMAASLASICNEFVEGA